MFWPGVFEIETQIFGLMMESRNILASLSLTDLQVYICNHLFDVAGFPPSELDVKPSKEWTESFLRSEVRHIRQFARSHSENDPHLLRTAEFRRLLRRSEELKVYVEKRAASDTLRGASGLNHCE